MQTPAKGVKLHRFLNQELGLPISDSVWVLSENNVWNSNFLDFDMNFNRNRFETSVPHFIILLRQWHRGNIDTFHSWQSGSSRTFVEEFHSQDGISNTVKFVKFKYPPKDQKDFHYIGENSLRLYFDAQPPNDLMIHVQYGEPLRSISLDTRSFKNQRYQQRYFGGKSGLGSDEEVEFILEINKNDHFSLKDIVMIGVSSDSCSETCMVRLRKIELNNYSRMAVESSLGYMRALGIGPRVYTSHGGFDFAQNFNPIFGIYPTFSTSSYYKPSDLGGRAQEKGGYAYIADFLSELGVEYIWSYGNKGNGVDAIIDNENNSWYEPKRNSLESYYPGFYMFSRTHGPYSCDLRKKDWGDPELRSLVLSYPRIKNFNELIRTSRGCYGDQASDLGMLLAIGLAKIESGENVEIVYYTHIGTPTLGSGDKMFNGTTTELFKDLMNHQYNFDNSIPFSKRTWVPSVNVVAKYRTNVEHIRENLRVDNNVVRIRSYLDPITGKLIPRDKFNPDELAGITVYVDDAHTARLFVDDTEVMYFVRNAEDQTGRESITIVDNSTPTSVIGLVPLKSKGKVLKKGVGWTHEFNHLPELIVEVGGRVELDFFPNDLWLYNVESLGVKYTKNKDKIKNVFFEIEMEDGQTISILEEDKVIGDFPALNASSGWRIQARKDSLESNFVLSTHSALWRPGVFEGRLGLPLGKVKRVRVGLLEAEAGDRLTDIMLRAYRPSGTSFLKQVPISGRIENENGLGVVDVMVQLHDEKGRIISTLSDRDGYYFFSEIDRNQIVRISSSKECTNSQDLVLEVLKPEVELDILLKDDLCDVN